MILIRCEFERVCFVEVIHTLILTGKNGILNKIIKKWYYVDYIFILFLLWLSSFQCSKASPLVEKILYYFSELGKI